MNSKLMYKLLCITAFASMMIPRSGTKVGGIPVTIPIVLYALIITLWISRPFSHVKFNLRLKSLFEELGVYSVFAYMLVCITSLLIGLLRNPDFSLMFTDLSALAGFVPIFFLVTAYVRDAKSLQYISGIIIFSLTLVCLYGLCQRIFGYEKMALPGITISYADAQSPDILALKNNVTALGFKLVSTFQNGNLYGNFLALVIPLPIALASVSTGRRRYAYLVISVPAIINLMLTLSRGAILAGIVSICLLVWLLRPARLPLVTALLFTLVGGGLIYGLGLGERLLVFDPTAANRIPMYQELAATYSGLPAISLIPDLLVGSGMGGSIGVPSARIPGIESSLLTILLKTGVLGTIAFILGIYGIFRFTSGAYRSYQSVEGAIASALAAGLAGACVQFAIDSVMMLPPTAMNFWMIAGLAVAAKRITRSQAAERIAL